MPFITKLTRDFPAVRRTVCSLSTIPLLISHRSEESDAIKAAWAVVDGALRTTTAGDINSGKVFKELEGVDAAVSAACSGVIRVLLSQVKEGP